MHGDVFGQLSIVLVIAAAVSIVMRLLRQPLIIGYIFTGIVVGPSLLGLIKNDRIAFDTFSDIGIALLLFIIGLELNVAIIRRLGRVVVVTAAAILAVVGALGYAISLAFDFNSIESLIIGLSLFFSSTIIIAKVLSDKKQLTRLHGRIALGIILFDDIVATFALLFIASGSGGRLGAHEAIWLVVKGLGLLAVMVLVASKLLPKLSKFMASSQEMLFLFAISWGFGIATLVNAAGYSIEVGALFAGVALAHLPYAPEIGARLKPLRDFFIILFFIVLGEGLSLHHLQSVLWPAIVFSLIVLVVKPLVVMAALGTSRYTKRTSFKTAINLSQISEFSIIVAVLAHSAGFVGEDVSAIITLVAIITIAVSTYLMHYDDFLYNKFEKHLRLFERSVVHEKKRQPEAYPLILFGYKKGGHEFIKTFRGMRKRFIVVDYDPEVIDTLQRQRIEYLYGDATDSELLEELNIENTKLIVSTITDHPTNEALLRYIRRHNEEAVIICHSGDYNDAALLYKLGATYVMLPHLIGSERMSAFIHRHGLNKKSFDHYREKHLVALGHAALTQPA